MSNLRSDLEQGCADLGLSLDPSSIDRLLAYLALLSKWNRVYNLTAVRDEGEMLRQHLLDSLAVVAPLGRELARHTAAPGGPSLLDVGSGAGLPGVVLALCVPALRVSCVDTVAKKAAFIQQAAVALGLSNLRAVHARVEAMSGRFDIVCSRAFASLADFTRLTRERLAPDGRWLAMKGKRPDAEVAGLDAAVEVFHVEQLSVPGLDAQRCIVWMRPRSAPSA